MGELLIQQTKWKELSYSKNEVIKAGEKVMNVLKFIKFVEKIGNNEYNVTIVRLSH